METSTNNSISSNRDIFFIHDSPTSKGKNSDNTGDHSLNATLPDFFSLIIEVQRQTFVEDFMTFISSERK